MLRLRYILGVVLIGLSLNSNAQTGCLLPNNTLYTSKVNPGLIGAVLAALLGGQSLYYDSPNANLTGPECYWASTSSTLPPCSVCSGGLLAGLCLGTLTQGGSEGTFTIECDIDDHAWALVLGAGAFGVYLIRRKGLI